MLRDCVLMTTFRRPEMLWHSLEHLSKCEGIEDVDVRVYVDDHANEPPHHDIATVLRHFEERMPHLYWLLSPATCHPDMGPVTLTALQEAYDDRYPTIMLVEEDVIVAPDFIRWSQAVHRQFRPFCAMGIVPYEINASPNQEQTCVGFGPWFCAWGASFPRTSIPVIVEHNVDEYHGNQHKYLDEKFPGLEFHGGAWDGLMCRLLTIEDRKCAFPTMPRCYNIGVYGHYRSRTVPWEATTLDGRVEELGKRMGSLEWMRAQASDCVPCSLDIPAWTELKAAGEEVVQY